MSDDRVATEPSPEGEAAPGSPAGHEDLGQALARAIGELRAIGRDLLELLSLRLDRAKLGVRETVFRLLIGAWIVIAATAATVVAVVLVVQGIVGGLAGLLGQAWAGRLVGGLAVLLAIASTLLVSRSRRRRVALGRLRSKYEPRPPAADRGATP